MAFEPQRFIHAANVRLDVPVSVQTSDVLTDELRQAFEDATLTSFDYVIRACIARRVDYLLLSGNVFIEADRSLRARLALLNGFRQLEAKQIQVFVLPGDADPAEAWRSIPEMPANVHVCYSSSPEPVELTRGDHILATVSASMWYGETDSFGIRVIAESHDGIQPFRIAVISQAKYEESQRMAAMAAAATDNLLDTGLQNAASGEAVDEDHLKPHGKLVSLADRPKRRSRSQVSLSELEDEESLILPGVPPEGAHSGDHQVPGEELEADLQEWEPGFVAWVDEMLREGRLNYLALTGELERSTMRRPLGHVHCPGTTQPRSHREATAGCCSLVEVSADGLVQISSIDTSSVDWKDIQIHVAAQTTLSSMLQTMKARLLQQTVGPSDRIWSVHWTLRCSLPVLQELVHDDLAVAVAVELDELNLSGQAIRLLHNVELVPDEWHLEDSKSLAQRYSDMVNSSLLVEPDQLQKLLDTDKELTVGWRQRISALISGLNAEQIQARMRIDGAGWFIPDLSVLTEDSVQANGQFTDDDAVQTLMEHDEDEHASVYDDESDDSEANEADADDSEVDEESEVKDQRRPHSNGDFRRHNGKGGSA